jgi:hypothetical protein
MIEEKQSSCVTKLNALAGTGNGFPPMTSETLPAKIEPKGHESVLRFPASKPATDNTVPKERRVGFFGRG